MTIAGLRATSDFPADQLPGDWDKVIHKLYPFGDGKYPLTALKPFIQSGSKPKDVRINWYEDAFEQFRIALGANLTTSNTTITVTSGALKFKAGDLLYVEQTGEVLLVRQNPSTDTALIVTRGIGDVAATAVDFDGTNINPNLTGIGSAYEEGSAAPRGVFFDPSTKYNFVQIFRNTYEHTNTALEVGENLRIESDQARKMKDCLEQHAIGLERAFLFGRRSEGTLNGKPLHTMGGILSFIPSANVTNYTAAVDMEDLELLIENAFKYGSREKLAFVGNTVLRVINQIVRKNNTMNIEPGIKEYGMDVSRLYTPQGTLVLKQHPLFSIMSGGTNAGNSAYVGWSTNMLILDMNKIKIRDMRPTKHEKDLQLPGVDGKMNGYITETTIQVNNPECFWLATNVSSAAADAA